MAAIRIRRGRGVRRVEGTMNKLEERYAAYLELRRVCGEILEWHFDAIKLRLAKDTFYTPDFLVLTVESLIEIHEVKGFWEDDARVKIKVAAAKFPFRFLAVTEVAKKRGGGWQIEEF
jgi:hypothetical protein